MSFQELDLTRDELRALYYTWQIIEGQAAREILDLDTVLPTARRKLADALGETYEPV